MSKQSQDFSAPAKYNQTTVKNEAWINVTVTKREEDGTVTQTSTFVPRPR